MKKKKAVNADTVEETAESLNMDPDLFELRKSLGTFRRKMKKSRNAIIAFFVAIVILIGALIGVSQLISSDSDSETLPVNILTLLMPKSKTIGSVTFYIEKYDDYDPSKDEPLDAWSVYYYDSDNNRIDIPDGSYTKQDGDTINIKNDFLIEGALPNIYVIKNVLTVMEVLFALCVVAFLIYVWYLSYCIREDKKKIEKRCYDISAAIPDFYYSKRQNKKREKYAQKQATDADAQSDLSVESSEENKE